MAQYRKAFVAVIGAVVAIAAIYGVDLSTQTQNALVTFDLAAIALGVWGIANEPPIV